MEEPLVTKGLQIGEGVSRDTDGGDMYDLK